MNKAARGAVAFSALILQGCAADLRKSECGLVPAVEYESCQNAARDPKWEHEEKRRERLENANTEEEKRKALCEALRDPELTECLVGAREPEDG